MKESIKTIKSREKRVSSPIYGTLQAVSLEVESNMRKTSDLPAKENIEIMKTGRGEKGYFDSKYCQTFIPLLFIQ
ncbi:MAG: hypothetical protein LBL90_07425 [Prevotellaceae bacterium]|nr:hypothetical protein [Prevotellaceae bacterium]